MEKEDQYNLTKTLKVKKFREVCEFFSQNNLNEFYLNEAGTEIILKKNSPTPSNAATPTNQASQMQVVSDPPETQEPQNGHKIDSPIAGTYYESPSPDSPPFVKLGDTVKKGQVIAIIEAMKIMNEISSPYSGKVKKVLVNNQETVSAGTTIMIIE